MIISLRFQWFRLPSSGRKTPEICQSRKLAHSCRPWMQHCPGGDLNLRWCRWDRLSGCWCSCPDDVSYDIMIAGRLSSLWHARLASNKRNFHILIWDLFGWSLQDVVVSKYIWAKVEVMSAPRFSQLGNYVFPWTVVLKTVPDYSVNCIMIFPKRSLVLAIYLSVHIGCSNLIAVFTWTTVHRSIPKSN
jgi:hypothetical protein